MSVTTKSEGSRAGIEIPVVWLRVPSPPHHTQSPSARHTALAVLELSLWQPASSRAWRLWSPSRLLPRDAWLSGLPGQRPCSL